MQKFTYESLQKRPVKTSNHIMFVLQNIHEKWARLYCNLKMKYNIRISQQPDDTLSTSCSNQRKKNHIIHNDMQVWMKNVNGSNSSQDTY